MTEPGWKTSISQVAPGRITVRGYDLMELIGRRSFGDVVYLLLSGDLPVGKEGRMIDACLVAAAEHSVVAPSVDAARFVASAGVPLQAAVAAGVIGLGDHHGGAVDAAAAVLIEIAETGRSDREAVTTVAARLKAEGKRLPGYGHVVHDPDPRAGRLLEVAGELGFRGRWCSLAETLEDVTEDVFGRRLRMNVDGALAAILLELGLDRRLGKAFYVIARTPGFVAHVFEEQTEERPYRDVGWGNVAYQGPAERPVPRQEERS
ncbi:MAG TPA: citryl-CoA lyase [Actinomycetota bacterium]|nr:citryl-CoA lyase [Actinomycetota bacterium]